MILCDSDCIIDFLKQRSPENGRVARALHERSLAISTVTAFEVYFGEPTGPRREMLDQLLELLTILPLGLRAAELAAQRGAELAAAGRKLDAPDLLIAGTALDLGLALITRNVRHFGRIEGLTVLDPA